MASRIAPLAAHLFSSSYGEFHIPFPLSRVEVRSDSSAGGGGRPGRLRGSPWEPSNTARCVRMGPTTSKPKARYLCIHSMVALKNTDSVLTNTVCVS